MNFISEQIKNRPVNIVVKMKREKGENILRNTVCAKNLFTEEKNGKCDLHSRISTIKSLHTFLFLHTFYNCTCLLP